MPFLAPLAAIVSIVGTIVSIVASTREPPIPPSVEPPNIFGAQDAAARAALARRRNRAGRQSTINTVITGASELLAEEDDLNRRSALLGG